MSHRTAQAMKTVPAALAIVAALVLARAPSRARADVRLEEPPTELRRPRAWAALTLLSGRDPEIADVLAYAPEGDLLVARAAIGAEIALVGSLSGELTASAAHATHTLLDGAAYDRLDAGDLGIALRFTPIRGSHRLSFTFGARVPSYDRLSQDAVERGDPQPGPGGGDVRVGTTWRHAFDGARWWAGVALTLVVRVGGPSSGVLTRVELGRVLFGPLAAGLAAEGHAAYGSADLQPLDAPAPIPRRVSGAGFATFTLGAFFASIEGGYSVLESTRAWTGTLSIGAHAMPSM